MHGPGAIYEVPAGSVTPHDQPLVIILGAAIALWGVALLAAAVPSLVCVATPPRSLRLGSAGIRVAAALVGLVHGASAPLAGLCLSAGLVGACMAEHALLSWLRYVPSAQRYDKIATFEDDDENDVGESQSGTVELAPLKTGGGGARKLAPGQDGGWADPAGPTAADSPAAAPPTPPTFSPVARAVGAALPAFYLALVRGLQLGTDVHVMGGRPLEVSIVCAVGQVALLAGALAVALQDGASLDLAASAGVCAAFSCAAPLGLLGAGLAVAGGAAQHPLQVSVSAAARLAVAHGDKGAAGGLGYANLAVLDALVGGSLLYTTLAATLPLEARDANAEWAKAKAGGELGGALEGRPRQAARVATLLLGWAAMALLHWPALAPSFA